MSSNQLKYIIPMLGKLMNQDDLLINMRAIKATVCHTPFPTKKKRPHHLKKQQDRIMWLARYLKRDALKSMLKEGEVVTSKQRKFVENFRDSETVIDDTKKDVLQHFLTQDIPDIHAIEFGSKTYEEIVSELTQAENAYIKRHGSKNRLVEQQGKEIVKVDSKLSWFDLEARYSKKEALALHHCGNSAGSRYDTILSLREKVKDENGETRWMPHCTFILNKETNQLGERKGHFNQKPASHFHYAIVKLLSEYPLILGLNGEQRYLSENDFMLEDLSAELANSLESTRPDLFLFGLPFPSHPKYKQVANILADHFQHKDKELRSLNDFLLAQYVNEVANFNGKLISDRTLFTPKLFGQAIESGRFQFRPTESADPNLKLLNVFLMALNAKLKVFTERDSEVLISILEECLSDSELPHDLIFKINNQWPDVAQQVILHLAPQCIAA